MKTGVIIAVIVIVLGGGAFVLTRDKKPATDSSTNTNSAAQTPATTDTTQTQSNATSSNTEAGNDGTITYSNSGFSPATLTVKAGATVTIKNTSSKVLQFDSDPHPVHTDDPELNESPIAPGKTGTIKVTVKGTHGYHNHLDESQTGTLIVE